MTDSNRAALQSFFNVEDIKDAVQSGNWLYVYSKWEGPYNVLSSFLLSCEIDPFIKSDRIPYLAFACCEDLMNYHVSNSVKGIEDNAFNGCINLSNITLGKNIKYIEQYAFKDCYNLPDIVLPESVISIGASAFSDCKSLKHITIPADIQRKAFYNCKNLETVDICIGVKNIGTSCFENCENLKLISIPNTVNTIQSDSFTGCNKLTDIKYQGTKEQWENVSGGFSWEDLDQTITVSCANGIIEI